MALIPAASLRGHFAGHPTPGSLYSDVAQHVSDLQDVWGVFPASVQQLARQGMCGAGAVSLGCASQGLLLTLSYFIFEILMQILKANVNAEHCFNIFAHPHW